MVHSSQQEMQHFNTSHVNVNPMNLSLFQSRLNLSLPILSHFPKNYQLISLFLTMGLINLQPQVFTGLLEIFFHKLPGKYMHNLINKIYPG